MNISLKFIYFFLWNQSHNNKNVLFLHRKRYASIVLCHCALSKKYFVCHKFYSSRSMHLKWLYNLRYVCIFITEFFFWNSYICWQFSYLKHTFNLLHSFLQHEWITNLFDFIILYSLGYKTAKLKNSSKEKNKMVCNLCKLHKSLENQLYTFGVFHILHDIIWCQTKDSATSGKNIFRVYQTRRNKRNKISHSNEMKYKNYEATYCLFADESFSYLSLQKTHLDH